MGSKAQRKKERHKQKRQKKKDNTRARQQEIQQRGIAKSASNVRHRKRIAQQTPKAWEGETREDAAVFDDAVLETLPPEHADHVAAVRQALQDISESRSDDALKRVATIPRSSPLSQWRLFMRGLVDWIADDAEAAEQAWKRLDPERRPGRIAIAMMTSLRTDLAEAPRVERGDHAEGESEARWHDAWDDQLLYHAKLLRRIRFDRAAIRVAEAGVRVPEEAPEILIGPKKLKWVQGFVAEYGQTEPDLAAAISQAAIGRAYTQNFTDLFEAATKILEGPRHDPGNRLLSFFFFSQFEGRSSERQSQAALTSYLEDLPQNEALSEPLRNAIAGQIHLNEAETLIEPRDGGMMDFLVTEREDPKAIRKLLKASIKAYPANRAAYKAHVNWIESRLDNGRMTKPERKPFEKELAEVMRSWSRGLPDDAEPRLWLVDHLLENDQTEEAKPHVDWLSAARHDDPRVKATPWKWALLESMRLARRKTWLDQASERLEEAERLWPAWLSRQWLPYLKAALLLRGGRKEEFEEQRERICLESGLSRDSLADACMNLGAAQLMRVPAGELKPLRAPVDDAVKSIGNIPLEELIEASEFFWDLYRIQLSYPAYRMHGGKFGRELSTRLLKASKRVTEGLDDPRIHAAVLWCSEIHVWDDGYRLKLPGWFSKPAIRRHPIFAAAQLNAALKFRSGARLDGIKEIGSQLREAAQSERDAYYRHWFVSLATEMDEAQARDASRFGFGFDAFSEMFGAFKAAGNDDEFDDDDELDFDPNCNCPECRAAKKAYYGKAR